MFALRTDLRGVLGIDDFEQHTSLLSFVADKLAKLVEAPAPHAVALRLAKPYPVAEALEFLNSDTAPGVFSLRNDTLGNAVVGVTTKACFSIANAFQLLTDALTPSVIGSKVRRRLKSTLQRLILDAHTLYILAGMLFSIGVRGKVGYAQIDAEEVVGCHTAARAHARQWP